MTVHIQLILSLQVVPVEHSKILTISSMNRDLVHCFMGISPWAATLHEIQNPLRTSIGALEDLNRSLMKQQSNDIDRWRLYPLLATCIQFQIPQVLGWKDLSRSHKGHHLGRRFAGVHMEGFVTCVFPHGTKSHRCRVKLDTTRLGPRARNWTSSAREIARLSYRRSTNFDVFAIRPIVLMMQKNCNL